MARMRVPCSKMVTLLLWGAEKGSDYTSTVPSLNMAVARWRNVHLQARTWPDKTTLTSEELVFKATSNLGERGRGLVLCVILFQKLPELVFTVHKS
jgi:hypothetical protein